MDASGATSARVLRGVLADPRMRRVQLAFASFNIAEYGTWVAVLVYAYQRSGTTTAALVAVAQLLPAAVTAPLAARVADRRGAALALRLGYWAQGAALATLAALLLAGAADQFVYGAAVLDATAVTVTRPAQAAVLPSLVADSAGLTAATVLSGWVESVSVLVGPALAGALIALDGPAAAISCFAALIAIAVVLVAPLRVDRPSPIDAGFAVPGVGTPRPDTIGPDPDPVGPGAPDAGAIAALRSNRGLVAVVALLGVQYVVIGALDVLVVLLADSVLGLGPAGAGYLTASFGAGSVLGSLGAVSLIGRARLARPMVTAAGGWAVLMAALGAWPSVAGAFVLLAGAGAARSVLDVSGRTMLLRAAPAPARARVFGLLESTAMLGLALGSIMVPALVELGGVGAAMIAVAALLIGVTVTTAAPARRIEGRRAAALRLPGRRPLKSSDAPHPAA